MGKDVEGSDRRLIWYTNTVLANSSRVWRKHGNCYKDSRSQVWILNQAPHLTQESYPFHC